MNRVKCQKLQFIFLQQHLKKDIEEGTQKQISYYLLAMKNEKENVHYKGKLEYPETFLQLPYKGRPMTIKVSKVFDLSQF